MSVRSYFSDTDLEAVRKATQAAERRTSGELVCVLVSKSDDYEEARWLAATLGALAGALLTAYGIFAIEFWNPNLFLWAGLVPFAGAATGWLLTTAIPFARRELAGFETLRDRVHQRATAAFVDEEVFSTRDRTGILIFVSIFERRVEVLSDEGIKKSVDEEAWREIVADLTSGLHDGRAGAALVQAVERCGALLEAHGVERRDDDANELADEPRVLDE